MNYLRSILLLLVPAVISACATPNEIRARAPSMQIEGAAKPEKVYACFVEKYDGIGMGRMITSVPIAGGGISVRYGSPGHPNILYIADISPIASGSRVNFYSNSIGVYDRDRDIVRYCAAGKY